jgi:hypothetical protein
MSIADRALYKEKENKNMVVLLTELAVRKLF